LGFHFALILLSNKYGQAICYMLYIKNEILKLLIKSKNSLDMKSLICIMVLMATATKFIGCAPIRQTPVDYPITSPDQQGVVSVQMFYDDLSPYGQWVDYPQYGYVWVPNEGTGFQPYSNGHWVMTEYGWTWVSNYSWGWAPFHYGRWFYDNSYGWMWVPGTVWGPAWVSWRQSGGYYGWCPLSPSIGMDVRLSFGQRYQEPANRWVFVPRRFMNRPDVNNYYLNRNQNTTIINNTTIIQNTYVDNSRHATYIAGPSAAGVQRSTGIPVRRVSVTESRSPRETLSGNQLRIFRPTVNNAPGNGSNRPAPAHPVPLRSFHPAVQPNSAGNNRMPVNPNQRVKPNMQVTPPIRQNSQPRQAPVRSFRQTPVPKQQAPVRTFQQHPVQQQHYQPPVQPHNMVRNNSRAQVHPSNVHPPVRSSMVNKGNYQRNIQNTRARAPVRRVSPMPKQQVRTQQTSKSNRNQKNNGH